MIQKHIFFLMFWFIIVFNWIPRYGVNPLKFVLFKQLVRSGTVTAENPIAGLPPLKLLCPFHRCSPTQGPPNGWNPMAACPQHQMSNLRNKVTEELVSKMEAFIIKTLCHYRAIIFNALKKKNQAKCLWQISPVCSQFLKHHQKIISLPSPLWPNISPFNTICFLSRQLLQFFY